MHATFPLGVSEAPLDTDADANLTYTVVEPTVPPLCDSVTLEPKLLPDVVDTSKPLGAVTVISAVSPVPETLKSCSLDTLFSHVLKAVNVPDVLIVELFIVTE